MRMSNKGELVLASSSPRRREIFKLIGLEFSTVDINVDEAIAPGANPETAALEIAKRKAMAAHEIRKGAVIIAADTIVILPDGTVLGKPKDAEDAVMMLRKMQGVRHTVITAVALLFGAEGKIIAAYDKADVTFLPMDSSEIDWYVSTGEPMDKAGAYGLQEKGMLFVQRIEGSPSAVIGLPVHLLFQLFKKAGLDIFQYIKKQL
jgi:septum formation protein